MRLIDADVALELKDKDMNWVYDLTDLEQFLANVPTVDAEPVRHGKWLDEKTNAPVPFNEKDGCPEKSCNCSECGEWLVGSDEYPVKGNYCPNCGAKMSYEHNFKTQEEIDAYVKNEYAEYLKSDSWRKVRKERIEYDDYECVCCGSKENLQVHHITYKRLGHEKKWDLATLCKRCHQKLHKILERERPFFENELLRYEKECQGAITDATIAHKYIINKKLAYLMWELFEGKAIHKPHRAWRLFAKSFIGIEPEILKIHPPLPDIPGAETLYRILRGKKKYGTHIDTIQAWEDAYSKQMIISNTAKQKEGEFDA